jgi:glycosyltransferase involved in cell wall biosynthesis
MKILHVIGESKWSGGAIVVSSLIRMAVERRWSVDILTTDPSCQQAMQELGAGIIPLDVIWRNIRPLRDLAGLARLWRFLRARPYDVVHTHTSKGGFVGRIAARLAGVPVVLHTVHGFAFHEATAWQQTAFYTLLERIAAWFCDAIVTVSHYHRDWALRLGIAAPRKLRAIPNGIDETRVATASPPSSLRDRIGAGPDCLVVVTHGRLAAGKGLEYLLAAIPRVQQSIDRSCKFVLVGDGPLREELEWLTWRLAVSEWVVFDGFRPDIGEVLAGADIVALPTLREGLSISLLEAMALGKPIVTTSIGSNLEATAAGECALTVRTQDADGLAEAIEQLSRDPARAQALGAAAKARFESTYRQTQMVEAYANLYQELVRKKMPAAIRAEPQLAHDGQRHP